MGVQEETLSDTLIINTDGDHLVILEVLFKLLCGGVAVLWDEVVRCYSMKPKFTRYVLSFRPSCFHQRPIDAAISDPVASTNAMNDPLTIY